MSPASIMEWKRKAELCFSLLFLLRAFHLSGCVALYLSDIHIQHPG